MTVSPPCYDRATSRPVPTPGVPTAFSVAWPTAQGVQGYSVFSQRIAGLQVASCSVSLPEAELVALMYAVARAWHLIDDGSCRSWQTAACTSFGGHHAARDGSLSAVCPVKCLSLSASRSPGIIFAPRSQGQNIGLVRHWRNYPGWRPFGATMYKNVVVLSGLIRAGQWLPTTLWSLQLTDLTVDRNHFSTLPGNMRPVKRLIFSVCNHQYITRVDVANNGPSAHVPSCVFAHNVHCRRCCARRRWC